MIAIARFCGAHLGSQFIEAFTVITQEKHGIETCNPCAQLQVHVDFEPALRRGVFPAQLCCEHVMLGTQALTANCCTLQWCASATGGASRLDILMSDPQTDQLGLKVRM